MGRQSFLKLAAASLVVLPLVLFTGCGGRHLPVRTASPVEPALWYYHHSYLVSDEAVSRSHALIDRAAAAGYNGMVLWDSGLNYLGNDFWSPANQDRMRDVIRYAAARHMRVVASQATYGYSNEALEANPNWAESERVEGASFQVDPTGKRLLFRQTFPGLRNSDFENGREGWFDTGDDAIGLSAEHVSGKAAAVISDAPANARFRQTFPLLRYRQYHLRLFYKSAHFSGHPMVSVFNGYSREEVLLSADIQSDGDHPWTQLDYTFNSRDSDVGQIYFGVWGGCRGVIFFDDVTIEETAFVYLTRREGTPVTIRAQTAPVTLYREGDDVNPIADERMRDPKAFSDQYHEPPIATLPVRTRLKPGDRVAIDYYAAQPVAPLHSVSMCMTEPASLAWVERNGLAISRMLPPDGGLFLGYDEIRNANTCGSCRAKRMTAGQLLSWSVRRTASAYSRAAAGHPLFIWSDMFDPYHNAHDHYYQVRGSLAGSWNGIPLDATIMNWNLAHLHDSLLWFAGRDRRQPKAYRQMIAGYYDAGDGAGAATTELSAAAGIPGLQGVMYTTWADDYSQLESFAIAARAGWDRYLKSVR